jgi:CBS domain-containing protein
MAKAARDLMTPNPACCTPDTPLNEVAQLMVRRNCGEIPVVDRSGHLVGVITDRDIVCRVVAQDKNPMAHTALEAMSQPVFTVRANMSLQEVVNTMEAHQVRRVPVVDDRGGCAGMIAQADIARSGPEHDVAELVREVSRDDVSSRLR